MGSRSIAFRKFGNFYQVFDDDAIIINYIFNYNIKNYKCGFPISALEKVSFKLKDLSINYIVKDDKCNFSYFSDCNNYDLYLFLASNKANNKDLLDEIIKKLDYLSRDDLLDILNVIKGKINL